MNRKPCGYLASQLRVNPTRLNISLVLIKTHFQFETLRILSNYVSRTDEVNSWNQRSQFFSVFSFSSYSSNFIGLMSRVISTQLFRIMTIKKNDDWDFVSFSRHLLTNMRTYANSLFSFYSARELFWTWYGDRWEANAFSGLALFNSHQSLGETLFKCFKLDATSLISATHARGKENSFCLPFLAYRVKAFVLPKNSLIMS